MIASQNDGIYDFRGEGRWLSNFHQCEILYEDIVYPTTEHAYQAAKTLNIRVRQGIARIVRPSDAMYICREMVLRPDWDDVKVRIMYEVNLYKFSQHENLKARLLETGILHLEEANMHGDTFWGTVDGVGENTLGKILMLIRSELVSIVS